MWKSALGKPTTFETNVQARRDHAPSRKLLVGQRSTHEVDDDAWSVWNFVFMMFSKGRKAVLTPVDLCLLLDSRNCPCSVSQAKQACREWGRLSKRPQDASDIDAEEWVEGLRKFMLPDGSELKGKEARVGAKSASLDLANLVGSVSKYHIHSHPLSRLLAAFLRYTFFPLVYLGLRQPRLAPLLSFSYRYLMPRALRVRQLDARGCLVLLLVGLSYIALIAALVLFVYLGRTRQPSSTDLDLDSDGVTTRAEMAYAATTSYLYYGQVWSEAIYPAMLLLFCALAASMAFVRQQHCRHHAWDVAARVGRLTHVVVRQQVSNDGGSAGGGGSGGYGSRETSSFRILDGVQLYQSLVETSNQYYWSGRKRRVATKYGALLFFGLPAACMSLLVRWASGYPLAGGDGALPIVATVAHISAMLLAANLLVEAAATAFEFLELLRCRAMTLGEMQITDDAEEAAAAKADTIALDLRFAEGIIAWGKLREYMLEERMIDHALVESAVLSALLLVVGHVVVLLSVVTLMTTNNGAGSTSGGGGGISIGALTLLASSVWACIACACFICALLVQVVQLNGTVDKHIHDLKAVRWEATSLLSAIKIAKDEGPDFLPIGGAFDNPRVRDPKRADAFQEELRWTDYVLERFISSEESRQEGGWLAVFGIGISTPRVAAFLSISGSVIGYAAFNLFGWLISSLR